MLMQVMFDSTPFVTCYVRLHLSMQPSGKSGITQEFPSTTRQSGSMTDAGSSQPPTGHLKHVAKKAVPKQNCQLTLAQNQGCRAAQSMDAWSYHR